MAEAATRDYLLSVGADARYVQKDIEKALKMFEGKSFALPLKLKVDTASLRKDVQAALKGFSGQQFTVPLSMKVDVASVGRAKAEAKKAAVEISGYLQPAIPERAMFTAEAAMMRYYQRVYNQAREFNMRMARMHGTAFNQPLLPPGSTNWDFVGDTSKGPDMGRFYADYMRQQRRKALPGASGTYTDMFTDDAIRKAREYAAALQQVTAATSGLPARLAEIAMRGAVMSDSFGASAARIKAARSEMDALISRSVRATGFNEAQVSSLMGLPMPSGDYAQMMQEYRQLMAQFKTGAIGPEDFLKQAGAIVRRGDIAANADELKLLGQQYDNVGTKMGKFSDSMTLARERLNYAYDAEALAVRQKEQLTKAINDGTISTAQGNVALAKNAKELEMWTGRVREGENAMARFGHAGMRVFSAMGKVMVWAVATGAVYGFFRSITDGFRVLTEFSTQMSRVGRTIQQAGFSTEQLLNIMGPKMLSTLSKLPVTMEDIGDTVYELTSLDRISAKEAADVYEQILRTNIAFEGNAADTARIMSQSYVLFNDQLDKTYNAQQKMAYISGVLSKVWAAEQFELTEITQSLKYSSAAAKTVGMDFKELVATLGFVSTLGFRGSTAGTGLTNFLLQFAKNYDAGALQKAVNKAGGRYVMKIPVQLDTDEFSLYQVMGELQKAVGSMSGTMEERLNRLSAAMNVFNLRGGRIFSAIMSDWENYQKAMDGIMKMSDQDLMKYTEELFKQRTHNISSQLEILRNSFSATFVSFFIGLSRGNTLDVLENFNKKMENVQRHALYAGYALEKLGGVVVTVARFMGNIPVTGVIAKVAIITGSISALAKALKLLGQTQALKAVGEALKTGGRMAVGTLTILITLVNKLITAETALLAIQSLTTAEWLLIAAAVIAVAWAIDKYIFKSKGMGTLNNWLSSGVDEMTVAFEKLKIQSALYKSNKMDEQFDAEADAMNKAASAADILAEAYRRIDQRLQSVTKRTQLIRAQAETSNKRADIVKDRISSGIATFGDLDKLRQIQREREFYLKKEVGSLQDELKAINEARSNVNSIFGEVYKTTQERAAEMQLEAADKQLKAAEKQLESVGIVGDPYNPVGEPKNMVTPKTRGIVRNLSSRGSMLVNMFERMSLEYGSQEEYARKLWEASWKKKYKLAKPEEMPDLAEAMNRESWGKAWKDPSRPFMAKALQSDIYKRMQKLAQEITAMAVGSIKDVGINVFQPLSTTETAAIAKKEGAPFQQSCAAVVRHFLKESGVQLTKGVNNMAVSLLKQGVAVPTLKQAQKGDIIITRSASGQHHVGIMTTPGRMMNVSSSKGYAWAETAFNPQNVIGIRRPSYPSLSNLRTGMKVSDLNIAKEAYEPIDILSENRVKNIDYLIEREEVLQGIEGARAKISAVEAKNRKEIAEAVENFLESQAKLNRMPSIQNALDQSGKIGDVISNLSKSMDEYKKVLAGGDKETFIASKMMELYGTKAEVAQKRADQLKNTLRDVYSALYDLTNAKTDDIKKSETLVSWWNDIERAVVNAKMSFDEFKEMSFVGSMKDMLKGLAGQGVSSAATALTSIGKAKNQAEYFSAVKTFLGELAKHPEALEKFAAGLAETTKAADKAARVKALEATVRINKDTFLVFGDAVEYAGSKVSAYSQQINDLIKLGTDLNDPEMKEAIANYYGALFDQMNADLDAQMARLKMDSQLLSPKMSAMERNLDIANRTKEVYSNLLDKMKEMQVKNPSLGLEQQIKGITESLREMDKATKDMEKVKEFGDSWKKAFTSIATGASTGLNAFKGVMDKMLAEYWAKQLDSPSYKKMFSWLGGETAKLVGINPATPEGRFEMAGQTVATMIHDKFVQAGMTVAGMVSGNGGIPSSLPGISGSIPGIGGTGNAKADEIRRSMQLLSAADKQKVLERLKTSDPEAYKALTGGAGGADGTAAGFKLNGKNIPYAALYGAAQGISSGNMSQTLMSIGSFFPGPWWMIGALLGGLFGNNAPKAPDYTPSKYRPGEFGAQFYPNVESSYFRGREAQAVRTANQNVSVAVYLGNKQIAPEIIKVTYEQPSRRGAVLSY
jgi:TP901 family phage tail tape measure protein